MKKSSPSIRRLTPKKFFPKIKNTNKKIEREVKKRLSKEEKKYPKINPLKFGMSLGIVTGIISFIATLLGQNFWTTLLLDSYGWIGYSVSPLGAVIGGIYSFIDFLILGYILIWIYNKLI